MKTKIKSNFFRWDLSFFLVLFYFNYFFFCFVSSLWRFIQTYFVKSHKILFYKNYFIICYLFLVNLFVMKYFYIHTQKHTKVMIIELALSMRFTLFALCSTGLSCECESNWYLIFIVHWELFANLVPLVVIFDLDNVKWKEKRSWHLVCD